MIASFTVDDPKGHIATLAKNHVDLKIGERAVIKITKVKSQILFSVDAKDATALRAATNAICKLLCIYEKSI